MYDDTGPRLQQLIILTTNQMGVYDLQTSQMIERVRFDSSTLMSPTISHTANGKINHQDSATEVAHSMHVYKGKIFLLVSGFTPAGQVSLL